MVNCNPETVSTDYDTSDRLYFEPLTLEDVLEVVHAELQAGPIAGVVVQLGGQTPLRAGAGRWRTRACRSSAPRRRRSTSPRSAAPSAGCWPRRACRRPSTARPRPSPRQGDRRQIGYPVLVRPSYVLGGRGMEIVYDDERLRRLHQRRHRDLPDRPVLVDRFLDDAVEIDVDALYDGDRALPRRRDGAHRGGRHPLRRLVLRAPADHPRRKDIDAHPHVDRGDRPGRGVRGPAQHPVRARVRRALRPGGQPARLPYGAVRLQGDRVPLAKAAARICSARPSPSCAPRGCCPARRRDVPARRAGRGQGGRDAVQPVPHRRGPTSTPCSARRCARPAR